ncbi:dopamine receptor 2-like [Asterias rubens]|uniref:dopamine receptor 2-like n=1 Tax=Asterias rubens TaxID=7604 RepID=UPI001455B85B|nr:dopamine receptor 2-like [Asterias rubens]
MDFNSTLEEEANSTTIPITTIDGTTTFFIVLNFIVGIIGLAGNTAVCTTVLRSKFLHDITHYLIASLAMSDFLCCFFFLITTMFVAEGHPFPVNISSGFWGEVYCRFFWNLHLFWSAFFASVFNLVVVTFDRYLAIVHPFFYARVFTVRRGLMLAASAWVFAFILELEFPIRSHYSDEANDCDFLGLGPAWFAKMLFIKSFTVSFILPLIFLIWAYYKIIRTLRKGELYQKTHRTSQRIRQGNGQSNGEFTDEQGNWQNTEQGNEQKTEQGNGQNTEQGNGQNTEQGNGQNTEQANEHANEQRGMEVYKATRRVVQSLIIISALFVVLLLPSEMGNVLLLYDISIDFTGSHIGNIFRITTVCNSVVNPMIYAIKYKRFRRAMKATMCPCMKTTVEREDTTFTVDMDEQA